jgi:hypothetical protein
MKVPSSLLHFIPEGEMERAMRTSIWLPVLGFALVACRTNALYINDPLDAGVERDGAPAVIVPSPDAAEAPDAGAVCKADFDSKVKPLLLADCGTCHSEAMGGVGPGFLSANPDMYTTVISYPGLIGPTPATSRLLTKDVHVGPSFHQTSTYTPPPPLPADAAVISAWIIEYNANCASTAPTVDLGAGPPGSSCLGAISPGAGTLSFDLAPLGPAFAGMSFNLSASVSSDHSLITLSQITLTTNNTSGVSITSPLFVRYAASAPTTPIDIDYDYLGKTFTVGPGQSVSLDPPLSITSWAEGELLGLCVDKAMIIP